MWRDGAAEGVRLALRWLFAKLAGIGLEQHVATPCVATRAIVDAAFEIALRRINRKASVPLFAAEFDPYQFAHFG